MGPMKKDCIVSAVDATSGCYVHIDLSDEISNEQQASSIVGSAAITFLFPSMDMSKYGLPYTLIDGGSTWNNNMISGINKCFE
jgi:hypothetical protein